MAIITKKLLKWYTENGRKLPWRISPRDAALGQVPDPYKIWISEIMLQQTTVNTAIPYFKKFLKKTLDSSLISSLNWSPKVGLDDGLKRTYEWYREKNNKD